MNTVDPLGQALYFTALSSASGEAAKEAKKGKKADTRQTAGIFSAMLKKNEEANELASAGLPAEIAGMSVEDAVVFLKDRVTTAGDKLIDSMSEDAFVEYRRAVSRLMKYVVKYSFEIEELKGRRNRRTNKERIFVQVRIIDEQLNDLAAEILANQADKFLLLKRVEEIRGLLVDVFAS